MKKNKTSKPCKSSKIEDELLEKAYNKWGDIVPKNQDLAGPVAASAACIELALNKYILHFNPNLEGIKELHFNYNLAVKVAFNMKSPYGLKSKFLGARAGSLEETLVAINKTRNHLVHPSDITIKELHRILQPLFMFVNKYIVSENHENVISKCSGYAEILRYYINLFTNFFVGIISMQAVGVEKLNEFKSELEFYIKLDEKIKPNKT